MANRFADLTFQPRRAVSHGAGKPVPRSINFINFRAA